MDTPNAIAMLPTMKNHPQLLLPDRIGVVDCETAAEPDNAINAMSRLHFETVRSLSTLTIGGVLFVYYDCQG